MMNRMFLTMDSLIHLYIFRTDLLDQPTTIKYAGKSDASAVILKHTH